MTRTSHATMRRPTAASLRHLSVIALIILLAMHLSGTAALAQEDPVGLGTADSFAVLAGSTITNTGSTTITGDVGLHPGADVTGFDSVTLDGEEHIGDAVAEQAKVDLVTAYDDAAGRTPVTTVATELGGETLLGGVYDSEDGTFGITGTLTLDAEGDPDTVWVFQAASTLITATDSDIDLINGADACNVYWQVGSSATLGTNSSFVGTIMALESISLTTGATVEGRVLARNGAVTLDTNVITNAACVTPTDDDNGNGNGDDDGNGNGDDDGNGNGDENGNGDDNGTDDTTVDDDTTGQIKEVPSGSVAAGGGPATAATSGLWVVFAGVLALLMAGRTVGIIARRRMRA